MFRTGSLLAAAIGLAALTQPATADKVTVSISCSSLGIEMFLLVVGVV